MRIICLTESLRSGGAERQLCLLAIGLKRRGWEVQFVTYAPGEFYADLLMREGVEREALRGDTRWQRFSVVRRHLRAGNQDAVISFLPGASVWAILAGIPGRKWKLIVSERIALPKADRNKWRALLYGLADMVTTNSHSNRLILEALNHSLRNKAVTIYNGVDMEYFIPAAGALVKGAAEALTLVSIGTMVGKKNMARLIEAMSVVRKSRPNMRVELHWYGAIPDGDDGAYREARGLIERHDLQNQVFLHQTDPNIAAVYQKADAVVHPSFYEGLPNVVCEGMACGLPVLMSKVCDAGNLVIPGQNGFLFDPSRPEDIARTIISFCELSPEARRAMGASSRTMAEALFDRDVFIQKYAEVIERAISRSARPVSHCPEAVPGTAREFLTNE